MQINKDRLINTFLELVQIDSPSGHEQQVVIYVQGILSNLKIKHTQDDFGNIVAYYKTNSADTLLLTAHLDTVEPGRGIEPIIENEIIKSKGNTILGADNKVGVAVILEILRVLFENNVTKVPNLEIVFTISEEVGNYGAVNLDYSLISASQGLSFDGATPVGTITLASPYYTRFDIDIKGKSTHASTPENGVNSLFVLKDLLNNIKLGRVEKDTLVNIGVVTSGHVRNTVPGEMQLKGEVRSYYEDILENNVTKLKTSIQNSCNTYNAQVNFDFVRENGGFKLSKNDSFVVKISNNLKKLNIEPIYDNALGCFDANIFFEHNIKVINLGNGSKGSHTTNERIDIESLNSIALCGLKVLTEF